MSDTASLNVDQETICEAYNWARVAFDTYDMISFLHICKKGFSLGNLGFIYSVLYMH